MEEKGAQIRRKEKEEKKSKVDRRSTLYLYLFRLESASPWPALNPCRHTNCSGFLLFAPPNSNVT